MFIKDLNIRYTQVSISYKMPKLTIDYQNTKIYKKNNSESSYIQSCSLIFLYCITLYFFILSLTLNPVKK